MSSRSPSANKFRLIHEAEFISSIEKFFGQGVFFADKIIRTLLCKGNRPRLFWRVHTAVLIESYFACGEQIKGNY
jgi:hypothetical protein